MIYFTSDYFILSTNGCELNDAKNDVRENQMQMLMFLKLAGTK